MCNQNHQREIIRGLYRALLLREPDPLGWQTGVQLLSDGTSIEDTIAWIVRSAEFGNKLHAMLRTHGAARHLARAVPDNGRGLEALCQNRAREIGRRLFTHLNRRVQAGPFKSMLLPDVTSWGAGDLGPKLLGCYEADLHGPIEKAISRCPGVIVNVGAAEGYYAAGLALRLPGAQVSAYDIDPNAREACAIAACENGVTERLNIYNEWDARQVLDIIQDRRALFIIDCEGDEVRLLTDYQMEHLRHSDFIIECHEFKDRAIVRKLEQAFQHSHQVEIISEGPRHLGEVPFLKSFSTLDRYLASCEFRPELMSWLVCWSRQPEQGALSERLPISGCEQRITTKPQTLSEIPKIVFTVDDNYTDPFHVAVLSLVSTSDIGFLLRVVSAQTEATREKTKKFLDRLNIDFELIFWSDAAVQAVETRVHGIRSQAVYARIFLPEIFPNDNRVLYLDCDLIVRRDLRELWLTNLKGKIVGAVEDVSFFHQQNWLSQFGGSYFNSGVILIDMEQWRAHSVTNKVVQGIRYFERYDAKRQYWDQSPLNWALEGRWQRLGPTWNMSMRTISVMRKCLDCGMSNWRRSWTTLQFTTSSGRKSRGGKTTATSTNILRNLACSRQRSASYGNLSRKIRQRPCASGLLNDASVCLRLRVFDCWRRESDPIGDYRSARLFPAVGLTLLWGLILLANPGNASALRRDVLAFYYGWWGTPAVSGGWRHWQKVEPAAEHIENSAHYPAGGAYDSHDPALLDRQAAKAKAAGITGFIASWWGQGSFEDKGIAPLLAAAGRHGLSVTAYYEKVDGADGPARVKAAIADLDYILAHYACDKAWLRAGDKPVVFIYGRALNALSTSEWQQVIEEMRRRHPGGVMIIADTLDPARLGPFDGAGTYNITGAIQHKSPDEVRQWAHAAYPKMVAAAEPGKISTVTVIPGYDDRELAERKPPRPVTDRWGGETYRALWQEAIAARPDWVLITSWNEWHEGSEIEPSVEYGSLMLDETREFSRAFLALAR